MIKGSFILIISLALLSPLPFVSPWYESAHAQVNKSTTGPPALVQNQTSTKPLESFMAYGKNFTKIPDVGRANTTATNLAHDMLMDVRHEYVELNRTSHKLNETLVNLTASVLNKARTGQNFGIFGSLAVQTGHDARTIEMLQNRTSEYVQVREELKSKTNQFKISPHVYAHFEDTDKKIQVYINLLSNNSNVHLGGDEIITHLDKTILAAVNESRIRDLAKNDQIESIRLPYAVTNTAGSSTSQGVEKSQADTLHTMGITGENVTVAIIDAFFNPNDPNISPRVSYSAVFATCADLTCESTLSHPHGTLVAHVVADMAPDANLELYAVRNNIGIDEAISHIISRGEADVITISLGVPGLGGDGSTKYYRDGTSNVAQAVDRARESGILVTVSAGNKAQEHWGGTYVPSSTVTPELIDGLDSYQSILEVDPSASGLQKACLSTTSSSNLIILAWDAWDQNPVSDDYDLFLFNNDMSQLHGYSTEWQLVNGQPLEEMEYSGISGSKCIVVASKYSTQNHNLHIYVDSSLGFPSMAAGSIGTPADARGAVSVGAVYHTNKALAPYSSRGPTDDGREKPEICGYSHVSTSGTSFTGTSASAPHVAGMAALLLDANPFATPDQIQRSIETSAESGPTGCGAGIMFLHDAAELLPDVTISGKADNSYVKTGDLITISVSTNNTVSNASATILDRSVPVNYAGDVVNATITVLENDTQGSVDFSLNIVDIDGNLVTATPRFLTNPNIQVDTVMPSIESSYASSLNSVTVVFSENIHAESVSVDDFVMNNTDIMSYVVSSNIVTFSTSTLDISSLPNVTLSGSVEDLAGNSLSAVSIPTLVGFDSADTVPPKFVSLSIDSNNLNAAFAKENDDITVNLTTDGTVSSADATILGRTVQTTISGNSVTFDTSVTSNDIQGLVDFTLNVKDQQNNILQITQANLTTDNVLVDTTLPELLSVKTASDGIIVVNFSEALDATSVSSTHFATNISLIGVASIGNTVNIKTIDFAPDATIVLYIDGTLSDLAGNLLSFTEIYHTTDDGVEPSMIDAYPHDDKTIIVKFDELVKYPIQPSDFEIAGKTVKSIGSTSLENYVVLRTTNPFGDDDLLSISINGTVEDLSGNLALQNIPIEFSGSLNSLSAIFTAKRVDTTTIELSFTLDGDDAIDLSTTSYNIDAFSITDPSVDVLSWNVYPYAIPSSTDNFDLSDLNLENYDHFGTSLASADFDSDGTKDLVVSAPDDGTGSISIVYLNSDGEQKDLSMMDLSMFNNLDSFMFGAALAAGDFDGNGVPDLAIGAPGEDNGAGKVHVTYLNSDGTVNSPVSIANPNTAADAFGTSLAAGDFDGDGALDLAIGAPGENNGAGKVYVAYLNSNGTVKSLVSIANSNTAADAFGTSLAAGDFDGDGVLDLVIGAPGEDNGAGKVHVTYMNSDGTIKNTNKISDPKYAGFGYALSVMDDLDGDGRSEFAATSLEQNHGAIHILHPKENDVTFSLTSDYGYGFGASLTYVGVLSDGQNVLATGIPFSSHTEGSTVSSMNGGIDQGTVLLLNFGDRIRITTSEIQNPNPTPLVTYNEDAQSNLMVDEDVVSDGTSAVASALPLVLDISSNNANYDNLAKKGDLVTIQLVSDQYIGSSITSVTILGRSADATSISGNTISANAIVQDSDTNGNIEFSIMLNLASSIPVTITHADLTSENVIVDTNAPSALSSTTITPTLVEITFDEPIATHSLILRRTTMTPTPTTITVQDGSTIPSSVLEFAIPPESSLSSDAKPHILIPESSSPSITDLAGNGAPEISITVSDGIAPSMQSAIVVSPSLIEVIFDEDIKFTSANALFHPAPTVNGIPTDTPEDISGNILRVPSENAFPSDTTLSVTIATNIITDIAGNIFEPGTILTSAANVLVPYTVDEITIHIPYAMTLNLNTLSTDDYSITFGSNPPSSISTVDLSTDAITVILTMNTPFGTGNTPFVEQIGDITDTFSNAVTLQSAIADDRAPPTLVSVVASSPSDIIVTFSEKISSKSTNIQNYDLSGATIRNTGLGVADGTVVISTGMFVRASISISNSTTIEDISNNTVQGGVTQSVVKN